MSQPGWFDAADSLGRWETWIDDPQRSETARYELAISSRQRGARFAEIVRPGLADFEEWRPHLRRMAWWSLSWMVSDARNFILGWSDSPNWASRELIEEGSPACSVDLFHTIEAAICNHWPTWEGDEHRGHSQYELLSALDSTRMSPAARQRLHELEDRFPNWPPQPPQPAVRSGFAQ